MDEKTKNILSLNHKEAMDFFLKSEQYHGFELPEYFVFETPSCRRLYPSNVGSMCPNSFRKCRLLPLCLTCA